MTNYCRARRTICRAAIRLLVVVVVLHALPRSVIAQSSSQSIRVILSSQISTAHPKRPHIESFLAVDPRNPKHMIAASMVERPSGQLGTDVYVSFDGGQRWSASRVA